MTEQGFIFCGWCEGAAEELRSKATKRLAKAGMVIDEYALRVHDLEAALRWYADKDNYGTTHRTGWINADRGLRAREALHKVSKSDT